MKTLTKILLSMVLTVSACQGEPIWSELQEQLGKAFGPEWTVAKDFNSFVAVRKHAKLLYRVSRIDPILGGDPWDKSIQSDYTISIMLRPKLTDIEYQELDQLRARLIARRIKGLDPSLKDTFSRRSEAEDTIKLPDYFFGNSAVYFRCTAERFFDVRPQSIEITRAEVLKMLETNCRKYSKEPEQVDGKPPKAPQPHRGITPIARPPSQKALDRKE